LKLTPNIYIFTALLRLYVLTELSKYPECFCTGLTDGLCPVLFHILQTLPRLVIKAWIRESSWDGRRRKMCLLSSLQSKPWCHHQRCLASASFLSISQTNSTLIRRIHTHVHKLFTCFSGSSRLFVWIHPWASHQMW